MPIEEAVSLAKEYGAAYSDDEVCRLTDECRLLKVRSDMTTGTRKRGGIMFTRWIEFTYFASCSLQAQALISALHTSGDVLRHDNRLYLKPEEVAEIVLKALPDTEEEAQACSPPPWHL